MAIASALRHGSRRTPVARVVRGSRPKRVVLLVSLPNQQEQGPFLGCEICEALLKVTNFSWFNTENP